MHKREPLPRVRQCNSVLAVCSGQFTQGAPAVGGAMTEERRVETGQEFPSFERQPLLQIFGEIELQRASIGENDEMEEFIITVVDYIDDARAICAHRFLKESRRTACAE